MVDTTRVEWPQTYRIIRSIHPPIDLFEDIADPRDWEALASAESKTNPRIWDSIGRLDLVPVDRRVTGIGASYNMAPFTHISLDRPGRFTNGSYGVYSAGNSEEVAIREVRLSPRPLCGRYRATSGVGVAISRLDRVLGCHAA